LHSRVIIALISSGAAKNHIGAVTHHPSADKCGRALLWTNTS
jgi:hypothetical protein